jgi:hypothetical protein
VYTLEATYYPFDSHQWPHCHINQFISVITDMHLCLSVCDSLTPPASACESPPIGKGTRFCVGEDGQFVMVNIDFLLMLRLTVRGILTPRIYTIMELCVQRGITQTKFSLVHREDIKSHLRKNGVA